MRSIIMFATLMLFLAFNVSAHANNNFAQHTADCTVKATLAYQMMNNRLDGLPKAEAERGLNPDLDDKAERMLIEVVEATYKYDIDNGSVDDFEKTVHQECMAKN